MRSILFPVILLQLTLVVVEGGNSPHDWESFKAYHGKSYPSPVHEQRAKQHFQNTLVRIAAHNKRHDAGEVSYTLALNKFADEDPQEFLQVRNGYKKGNHSHHHHHHPTSRSVFARQAGSSSSAPIGSSSPAPGPGPAPAPPGPSPSNGGFDWRTKNAVSAVMDQGQCGSCWAFSTMGAIESQVMKNGGAQVLLSEEQLVDCDTSDSGCNGGDPLSAYQYLQSSGGADSNADYAYTAGGGQGGQCQSSNYQPVQQVTGGNPLQPMPTDANTLQQYLQTNGPLSLVVDASTWDSQYSGGIISAAPTGGDHAVLLVGWGADSSGNPYWIIKNSWSTDWGMQGFCYVAIGSDDCGVTQYETSYPSVPPPSG